MQTHYFTRDVPMGDIEEIARGPVKNGNAMAKFYTVDFKDEAASNARGRYVGRKVDMVRIIIPGDKHSIVERRVRESDKQRWPKQWEAFRRMEDFAPEGTLLDTWPMLSKQQVEDLKYNNIFTVEQLSDLPDDKLSAVGLGGRMLRKHAQAFVETAKRGAVPAQLVAENEQLKGQVSTLITQVTALTKQIEILAAKAGEKIEDMANPIQEAKIAVNAAAGQNQFVHIPDGYESMGLPALRSLCSKFTEVRVLNKEQAIELIAEYQAAHTVKV